MLYRYVYGSEIVNFNRYIINVMNNEVFKFSLLNRKNRVMLARGTVREIVVFCMNWYNLVKERFKIVV